MTGSNLTRSLEKTFFTTLLLLLLLVLLPLLQLVSVLPVLGFLPMLTRQGLSLTLDSSMLSTVSGRGGGGFLMSAFPCDATAAELARAGRCVLGAKVVLLLTADRLGVVAFLVVGLVTVTNAIITKPNK